ncbi:MAG: beta strand repeat-containing protein, partial [Betaproteobacteria bacterium]
MTAAQAAGAKIGGAGQVRVTGLSNLIQSQSAVSFAELSAATTVVVDSSMTLPAGINLGSAVLELSSAVELTASVDQVTGRAVKAGAGTKPTLTIVGLTAGTVDFTGVAPAAELNSRTQVSANLQVSSGSRLGPVALILSGGADVRLAAAQASLRAISGSGSVSLYGLDGAAFDLSRVDVPSSATIGRGTEINAGSVLGDRVLLQITDDATLVLTAAQVTTGSGNNIGGRVISGTGSVTVTALGSARAMLNNITVTGLVAAQVPASAALNTATNLGGAVLVVDSNATLTLEPSQTLIGSGANAVAREMVGAGAIRFALAAGTSASPTPLVGANLSKSEVVLSVSGHQSLSGISLGATPVVVDSGGSVTLTATQANGRKVSGAGQVFITSLGSAPQADLSGVTAASASALVTSSTVFKGTLGKAQLVISPAVSLTINGPIVNGATVTGGGRLIVVTGEIVGQSGSVLTPPQALATFDLSKVAKSITVEARINAGTELETDAVDIRALGQLAGVNDVVQLRPTADTKAIRLAGVPGVGTADPLFINTTDLREIQVKELVVGSYTGRHVIGVGDLGSSAQIVFSVPLTLQAPVSGGHVFLNQPISGEALKIYGSGATTSLNSDILMRDDVLIDDRVIVTGGRTIVARTALPGGPGVDGIRISGDVVSNPAAGDDSLTLTAGGYDITFNKSVQLNSMSLSNFDDLKFEGDVEINQGTLEITLGAGDTVRFGGKLTLKNGARLVVNGAANASEMVIFDGGLVVADGVPAAVTATLLNVDQVVVNNAAGAAATPGYLTINNASDVRLTAGTSSGRTLIEANRSDGAGVSFGLPSYPSKTGLTSPAASSSMSLSSIDLVVNAAGAVQFNRGLALLGGSTVDINGGSASGITN